MNTDCVMLILEHACKKKVHAKADWLHATTGMSRHPCSKMGSTFVETLQDGEFMRGEGFIKSERTIVLRDTIQAPIINASTFCSSVWTGHISKKNARADAYDLALVDGDGAEDLYEEQRSEDDERERVSGRYKRDPCVGWGRREVRFYTIALSHDIRVSVSFDVVVVPTSWWMDDLEHYWFVIQLLSGKRSSDQTISCDKKGYSRTYMGIDMIGWQSRILEVI